MSDIQNNLLRVRAALPEDVSLVAVSKFHPSIAILECYEKGQRIFGESRVQELRVKQEELPHDIIWHFIGHLQQNKVKYIAPYVHLIESVDSERLLQEINKQAEKNQRLIDCLIELHIAKESTKSGFSEEECYKLFQNSFWKNLENIRIRGLMCMASNTTDEDIIEMEFEKAAGIFREIKEKYFFYDDTFNIRSWGMSSDYHLAVKHGSNMVRVGTAIFGEREY